MSSSLPGVVVAFLLGAILGQDSVFAQLNARAPLQAGAAEPVHSEPVSSGTDGRTLSLFPMNPMHLETESRNAEDWSSAEEDPKNNLMPHCLLSLSPVCSQERSTASCRPISNREGNVKDGDEGNESIPNYVRVSPAGVRAQGSSNIITDTQENEGLSGFQEVQRIQISLGSGKAVDVQVWKAPSDSSIIFPLFD
jgi:hypothetical protein